jgi:glucose/mannose-6-phosphate isomerase
VADTLGFLDAVAGLPEQLGAAHDAAGAVAPDRFPGANGVQNVVVLGMGGSGIAGDVLAATANGVLPVPVTVLKQIRTPRFVGPATLAFAVSYSGTTEETVAMARGAVDAGARLVAISSGGPLADLATSAGGLHLPCPQGYMPRAALGALVAPIFVTLFRMGLLPDAHGWLVAAQAQLAKRRDECAPTVGRVANPARELARRIDRTIPLVHGGGALGAVAAMRWKADVNENAKAPAFWNAHPELDHNEICGWGQHGDVTRQVLTLVELRHDFEHEQLARRFEVTRPMHEEAVHQILEVRAAGEGRLAQLLDLMYVGDWTSCYLALDNDVDPGPIDAIATLKAALAD